MSQIELAAYVQSNLRESGIEVVLTGGAAVAFYSNNKYASLDLDLVNIYFGKRSVIYQMMLKLGFIEEGRHFSHPETKFFVEFPPGPLAVGREAVKEIKEHDFETGKLKIISPTDSVKDRLLGYFYWGDRQSLNQAIMIARSNAINLKEIERWSQVEGKYDSFVEIKDKLTFHE